MTAPKMVHYVGTSDVRVIGDFRWDEENDWAVKRADLPDELLEEITGGELKSEFEVE